MNEMKEDVIEMRKIVKQAQKEEQSLAMELLNDMKKANKRLFILCLIEFFGLLLSVGYTIYVLNDIGYEETTEVIQENTDGYNNYVGNDGDIINGKAND